MSDEAVQPVDLAYEPRFTKTTCSVGKAREDLSVEDVSLFTERDLVRNTRTGEIFLVTSVSSLTITRGIGGPAADMEQGDELLIVGRAVMTDEESV